MSDEQLTQMAAAARAAMADPARITIVGKDRHPRFELFHAASSLCSQKVRTVLHEKELPYRSNDMIILCSMGPDGVVPAEQLVEEAKALARRMGANPHMALRTCKQLLTANAPQADLALVQQRELEALLRCYASAEHKEAVAAFVSKRVPDFKAARAAQSPSHS